MQKPYQAAAQDLEYYNFNTQHKLTRLKRMCPSSSTTPLPVLFVWPCASQHRVIAASTKGRPLQTADSARTLRAWRPSPPQTTAALLPSPLGFVLPDRPHREQLPSKLHRTDPAGPLKTPSGPEGMNRKVRYVINTRHHRLLRTALFGDVTSGAALPVG